MQLICACGINVGDIIAIIANLRDTVASFGSRKAQILNPSALLLHFSHWDPLQSVEVQPGVKGIRLIKGAHGASLLLDLATRQHLISIAIVSRA